MRLSQQELNVKKQEQRMFTQIATKAHGFKHTLDILLVQ